MLVYPHDILHKTWYELQPLRLRTAEAPGDLDHVDILPWHREVTPGASGAALSLPEVTGRAQRLPDQGGRLLDVQIGKNTHVSNFYSSLFWTNILHPSHKINCLALLIAKTLARMSASRFLVHNKVHFLLRVNDLFLVNFVHIWGRRGVTLSHHHKLFVHKMLLYLRRLYHDSTKEMRMMMLTLQTHKDECPRSESRKGESQHHLTDCLGRPEG